MPLGESIGDAYVRVHASGDEVRANINDSFGGLSDDVNRRAGEHGEAYRRGWERQLDLFRNDLRRSLDANLTDFGQGLERNRVILEGSESRVERLRRSLADLSDETDRNRRATDGSTGGMGRNANAMEQMRARIRGAAEALGDSSRATEDWRNKMRELNTATEEGNRQIAQRQRSLAEFDRLQRQYNMDFSELIDINRRGIAQQRQENDAREVQIRSLQRLISEQERNNQTTLDAAQAADEHRAAVDRLGDTTRQLVDSQNRLGDSTDRTSRRFTIFHRSVDRFNNTGIVTTMRRMGNEADRNNRIFGRLTNNVDRFSDVVGRGFGRGSRNDFLNFMGGMARGFVRLIGLIPKAIDLVATFATTVAKNMATSFTNAGGGLSGMAAAAGTLGVEMAALAPVILAAVAAMAAAVLIIGPLISLFSGLAAAATALAASLAFAVVGAVAPLVGLLAPLAIGLGVAFVAFKSVFSAADALTNAVRPLKDEFRQLGAEARKPILEAITENARKLAPLLKSLQPLFHRVSESIAGMMDDFGAAANDPGSGLNRFIARMTKFAPNALSKLGTAFGDFLSGFLGVFRALTPIVNDFLGWLKEITAEFDNWANSRRGQKEMKNFFDRAEKSAKSVWDLLKSIGDVIGTLFDAGKGTGDSIIDTMAAKLEEFNQFLKDNPDALADWFQLGQDVLDDLGSIVVSIGEIADALDDDRSRSNLLTTLESIGAAVELIDNVTEAVQILIDLLTGSTHSDFLSGLTEDAVNLGRTLRENVISVFENIGDAFQSLGRGFSGGGGAGTLMTGIFTGWIPGTISKLEEFRNRLSGFFSAVPGRITHFFSGMGDKIGNAIGKVNLFKTFDFPSWGSITGKFKGLAMAILKALGKVILFRSFDFPSWGSITSRFRGLAVAILGALGKVILFKSFDFPSFSSITSKFKGLGTAILGALGKVVLFKAIDFPSWDSITSKFAGLGAAIVRAIGSIDIFPTIHMPKIPSVHLPDLPSLPDIPGLSRAETITGTGVPFTSGGAGTSKTFNNVFHITSPNDPRAVANELLNQLVATGY